MRPYPEPKSIISGWTLFRVIDWADRGRSRSLRDIKSGSAAFSGCFLFFFGAPGTVSAATSPAGGAAGPALIAGSAALSGSAAVQGEGGPCNQTGNAKTCQDLFEVIYIHGGLLPFVGICPFPRGGKPAFGVNSRLCQGGLGFYSRAIVWLAISILEGMARTNAS